MDKLKEILGEELYSKVSEKLGDKKVDIVNNGNWIPKSKFDDVIEQKNNYKKQLEEIDTEKFEKKQQELWQMEKELMLDKHGLSSFKDFFHAEDRDSLEQQINNFKGILQAQVKGNQKQNSYKPESHKPNDAYAEAKKNNDITGMVSYKLSRLFK